jgi:4-amino-4-deoxy-L-arabinose transferase-like glycosyltransferase
MPSISSTLPGSHGTPPVEVPVHATAPSGRRTVVLLLLSLSLVAAVLLHGITKGEFSENVDETVHACTGLYVASFLHDLPLRHPVEYTYRYYAQYPVLGIVMYPPAFYFVEGVAFFIFGASVLTARLTILGFALLGLFFWFKLVNELEDEYTAALSTILLGFLPSVLNYEKVVMLDVPLMSLCIAASYFWIVFLRRGLDRHLCGFAIFLSLAFLTKHHAVYLLLWCSITLVLLKKWDRLWSWKVVAAAAASFVLVTPVYLLQIFKNASLGLNVKGTSSTATMSLLYYWASLPELIGWGAIVLSAVGVLLYLWTGKRENALLMLAWIASCYVFFTLIRHKEPRYIMYWVPAFAYFAVAPFTRKNSQPWKRTVGFVLVAAVILSYSVRAWNYQRYYVSGYAQLAQTLTKSQGGVVLVDMDLPGNFIFFMRAYDPARRFVILRKAMYDVRTVREWGVAEFAHDQNDVEQILKNDSVRYIVAEQNEPLYFSSQTALREILEHSGQYRPLEKVAIESNMKNWQDRSLGLYESIAPVVPAHGMLHINMQNLHHNIDIPFEDLTH